MREEPTATRAETAPAYSFAQNPRGREAAISLWVAGGEVRVLNVNFEYKREFEGDRGPNTPGMGTVACSPGAGGRPPSLLAELPSLLASLHYVGPLDVSFMVPQIGPPRFLEFTARFGDPELMSEILLLNDVSEMLARAARGAMHVVPQPVVAWAAGVIAMGDAQLVTNDGPMESLYTTDAEGGPVWCSSAAGRSPPEALARAYAPLADAGPIRHRRDIGHDVAARTAAIAAWAPLSAAAALGLSVERDRSDWDGD